MRILIVPNGSNHSVDPALMLGIDFAQRVNEPPTILKLFERGSDQTSMIDNQSSHIYKTFETVNMRTRSRGGNWSEEIIQETQNGDYDLVMIREKRTSGLARLYHKSLTAQITEHVPCSVLVVRGQAVMARRILLCDSGASHLATVRRFTDKMKDIFSGYDITVLHVMSQISAGPGIKGKQLQADAEALISEHSPEGDLLLQDMQMLKKSGFHPVPKIRHGLVLEEILDEAQNGDYDLVVIGAHRSGKLSGYLLDNLARKLITKLDRSVLVLK